jgi:serine/threonine-protein kinase
MGRAASEPEESLLPEGTRLGGRYRLERALGTGGMGTVYAARDESTAQRVALKLLHPALAEDRDLRRRFRREASVLRALEHPRIVRVLDLGEDDQGRLFTVMELVEGETLLARIERAPLDAASLAPIVLAVAEGLEAVHAHGVLHGDLTPGNVLLTQGATGPVKLLDFGLSKVLGLERLTRTGELVGTPAYMAPELFTGRGELDARIDTYALGVVSYHALAGRPPFRGKVPGALMMDIVMGHAPPLRELVPAVSEPVAAVVARAMSRAPEARFASASTLAAAFADAAR